MRIMQKQWSCNAVVERQSGKEEMEAWGCTFKYRVTHLLGKVWYKQQESQSNGSKTRRQFLNVIQVITFLHNHC